MDTPKLYVPKKDYFIDDILDSVNEVITYCTFKSIDKFNKELNYKIGEVEKTEHIHETAMSLRNVQDIEKLTSKNGLQYALNLEDRRAFITKSSMINICLEYPEDAQAEDVICLLGKELMAIEYDVESYQQVYIEDYEEYINIFFKLYHKVIDRINNFILFEYLIGLENNLANQAETFNIPSQKNTKVPLPYQIALLNELGFFELSSIKKLSKEQQYGLLSKLLGASKRQVKGNILVLNANSQEDRLRYTSFAHIQDAKDFLKDY